MDIDAHTSKSINIYLHRNINESSFHALDLQFCPITPYEYIKQIHFCLILDSKLSYCYCPAQVH